MKKSFLNTVFVFFGLLIGLNSYSQVQDASLWMNVSIEKKIIPTLSVSINQEFRMNENISELGTFFTDVGLNYKINKFLKFSASYRFINKRRLDDSYSIRHRYYFDLVVRKKFNPVTLSFRTRFQSQYADVFSSEDGKIPDYYSRNKLTLKVDAGNNIQPYVYAELFSPLKRPYNVFIDNTRYCLGVEYSINRMNTIDVFYMFQKECNVKNPETAHVIGVGYYINL